MPHPELLDRLVRRVTTQVRRRRVEHYALRGAFWASLLAVLLLAFKGPLAGWAVPLAAGAVAVGALGGAAWGALKRTSVADAARLADRAWGLEDRVATVMDWVGRADRPPLVDALIADTLQRIDRLEPRAAARRVIPRDGRFLPIPLGLALVLALAPAIPVPSGRLPDFSSGAEEEQPEQHAGSPLTDERSRPSIKDRLKPPSFQEREFATRAGGTGAAMSGDLSAVFKDTALSAQRPDFQSFLKKGDDRLKLLEQADRLPDLQSDFTTSQYKMMFRKSKSLSGGLRPDQISPQKLKELLEEMERLGRKGGANWQGDAAEGMEALEGGQPDRALEAMQRALDKMRAQEESSRSGKGLKGGRESGRGGSASRDRRGGEGGGPDDQDFGEGEGLLPGKGRSNSPKGEASQRLRGNPYDVGVEGESRRGRKEGYDTNMTGRGGQMGSRLQYLGVIGQYRKMMEDSIARESIPRDYHSQIKDYFQALDER
jgi:hypothetical protein